MIISLAIFAITYFFIATEKVDKAIAALLGAVAALLEQLADSEGAVQAVQAADLSSAASELLRAAEGKNLRSEAAGCAAPLQLLGGSAPSELL